MAVAAVTTLKVFIVIEKIRKMGRLWRRLFVGLEKLYCDDVFQCPPHALYMSTLANISFNASTI
jgi:hypothetical protein